MWHTVSDTLSDTDLCVASTVRAKQQPPRRGCSTLSLFRFWARNYFLGINFERLSILVSLE